MSYKLNKCKINVIISQNIMQYKTSPVMFVDPTKADGLYHLQYINKLNAEIVQREYCIISKICRYNYCVYNIT